MVFQQSSKVKAGCCKAYPRDSTTRHCDHLTYDQAIEIAAKLHSLHQWMNVGTTTPATQNFATLCKMDGSGARSNLARVPGIF
mmetsp:Transcript_5727/g.7642  ORF Transcript_5727/g.7642 Transcript_5727/m.7642 type:complete len:83 (+) Transcript_5727:224-472(+)